MKKLDYTYLLTKEILKGHKMILSRLDGKTVPPKPVKVLIGGCLLYQFPFNTQRRRPHTI